MKVIVTLSLAAMLFILAASETFAQRTCTSTYNPYTRTTTTTCW